MDIRSRHYPPCTQRSSRSSPEAPPDPMRSAPQTYNKLSRHRYIRCRQCLYAVPYEIDIDNCRHASAYTYLGTIILATRYTSCDKNSDNGILTNGCLYY